MSGTAVVLPMQRDGSFGDLLVQLPLLHGLRHSLGAERVVVMAPHAFARLTAEVGIADEVHVIADEDHAGRRALLRAEAPRWALSLRRSSPRSSWLLRGSGAELTLGWRSLPNRLLLDRTVPRVRDTYYALVLGRLLAAAGGAVDIAATGAALAARGTSPVSDAGPLLVAMPAGKVAAKQWGVANYLALGERLAADWPGLVRVVVLGPREAEQAAAFEAAGWRCVRSPSVNDLAALCARAHCIVANDCGPGHVAQMSGRPMVTLFHNEHGRERRDELLKLWWWRRAHARAISTEDVRPLTEVPVAVVAEEALAAVADATPPTEARWWA